MNPFKQPGGWADRISAKIRDACKPSCPWVYLGACVELTGPLINYITDDERAQRLTFEEFKEAGPPLEDVANALGYSNDLPLRTDRHVTYWRSQLPPNHPHYPGREILFLDHSRIEYIWVRRTPGGED